jgi:hypothetical protein
VQGSFRPALLTAAHMRMSCAPILVVGQAHLALDRCQDSRRPSSATPEAELGPASPHQGVGAGDGAVLAGGTLRASLS